MLSDPDSGPGKVVGIGVIFFKSPDKRRLDDWYRLHLGINGAGAEGAQFLWRSHQDPAQEHLTAWSIFPDDSTYFGPGSRFSIDYVVDDLNALLAKLHASGVAIDPNRGDHHYGRFAWLTTPTETRSSYGNRCSAVHLAGAATLTGRACISGANKFP